MTTCLLFDSDGTLVDSELINARALSDELQLHSVLENPENLLKSYRGWRLMHVLEDLGKRHGVDLDAKFDDSFRARAAKYFESDLQAVNNIQAALDQLQQPKCVASNAPMYKLQQVLSKTGLDLYFNGNIYSAYDISLFKPDPGLFLHAAASMKFNPSDCIVIEDSVVGLQAALSAEMKCVFYNPGKDSSCEQTIAEMTQYSPGDVKQVHDMLDLPDAIRSLA